MNTKYSYDEMKAIFPDLPIKVEATDDITFGGSFSIKSAFESKEFKKFLKIRAKKLNDILEGVKSYILENIDKINSNRAVESLNLLIPALSYGKYTTRKICLNLITKELLKNNIEFSSVDISETEEELDEYKKEKRKNRELVEKYQIENYLLDLRMKADIDREKFFQKLTNGTL